MYVHNTILPQSSSFSHYLINPPIPGRQGGPGAITHISLREMGVRRGGREGGTRLLRQSHTSSQDTAIVCAEALSRSQKNK